MPFAKEDKILIKNLWELKVCDAKHLVRELRSKGCNVGLVYKLLQKLQITGSVDHCPGSGRRRSVCTADKIDFVDELMLHRSGQTKNNICTLCRIIQLYRRQKSFENG